jgi:Domain of unknown function (DUF5666)
MAAGGERMTAMNDMEVSMTTTDDRDPGNDLPIAEPLRPPGAPEWVAADADLVRPVAAAGTAEPARSVEPASPADGIAFPVRNVGPGKLRAGVVAGAAVALAVGAVATSLAATPPATNQQPAGVTTPAIGTPFGNGAGAIADPALVFDPTLGADDPADLGRMGGMGFRDITIASISGSDVTLKTDDGWTRTITISGSVALTKGGQTIAVSDLAVGDEVRIQQTRNSDGSYTVDGLAVVVPSVQGTVSESSSSGFKVTSRDGSVWTVTVDGSTSYQYGTGSGTAADVTNGTNVVVLGESTGDNALRAITVRVAPDRIAGTVASKSSSTIVVTKRDGSTVTINVDSATTYRVAGIASASLSDITTGMTVGASGRAQSDGSINADVVAAGNGHGMLGMDGDGPFGGRGRGGFGPGMMDDDQPAATPSATP